MLRPDDGGSRGGHVDGAAQSGGRARPRRLLGGRARAPDRSCAVGDSRLHRAGPHHGGRAARHRRRGAGESGRRCGDARRVSRPAPGLGTRTGGDPALRHPRGGSHDAGNRPRPGTVQVRRRPGRPAPRDRRARRGPGGGPAQGGAGEGAHARPGARAGRARAARRARAPADPDRDEPGVRGPRARLGSRRRLGGGGGGRAHEPGGGARDAHVGAGPEPRARRGRPRRRGPGGRGGVVPGNGGEGARDRRAEPAIAHRGGRASHVPHGPGGPDQRPQALPGALGGHPRERRRPGRPRHGDQ